MENTNGSYQQQSALETLKGARQRIIKGWTREVCARNESGEEVDENNPSACRFCALGALGVESANLVGFEAAKDALLKVIRRDSDCITIPTFNDLSKSKHRVVKAFDKAIENLENTIKKQSKE